MASNSNDASKMNQQNSTTIVLLVVVIVFAALLYVNAAETSHFVTGMRCRGWPFAHFRGYRYLLPPMVANLGIGFVIVVETRFTTHWLLGRGVLSSGSGIRFSLLSLFMVTTFIAIFIPLLRQCDGLIAAIPPRRNWYWSRPTSIPVAYGLTCVIFAGVRGIAGALRLVRHCETLQFRPVSANASNQTAQKSPPKELR